MISDSTKNDSVKSEIYIYLKFCLWSASPCVTWVRSDGRTRGRAALRWVRLTACRPSGTPHTLPAAHHLLLAAIRENGTRPWSDKGIRMDQRAAPLRSLSIVTILLWWQTHTHTHTCFMPTSKSGPFLTVTFCLPAAHRQTEPLNDGSTISHSGEVSCFAQ